MRAAAKTEEVAALAQRCKEAQASAKAIKSEASLSEFKKAVAKSKAVFNRGLGVVEGLVSNDNALYNTFYQQVEAEARIPEDNSFDHGRGSVDSLLFPFYHQYIRMAALSIDGIGVAKYGSVTLVLREDIIGHRATVFEENSMDFCIRNKIVAGSSIPPGFRASWADRDQLAEAKLHSKIKATTKPEEFPAILLEPGTGSGSMGVDFIEVHIYGPFNRQGLEQVVCRAPQKKPDKVLLRSLKSKLEKIGVLLHITQ